jgi:uroporphyrinogen-III decarboxylase
MNSRERMAAAMRKETPDRVPVMCQLAIGHYMLNTDQNFVDIWHDSEAFALVQLQRRYRFDGILVNLPGRDPDWRKQVVREFEHDGEHAIEWSNGWFTKGPRDDNPHVYVDMAANERNFPTFDEVDPDKLLYMEPHDISAITYPYSWGFGGDPAPVDKPEEFFPPWHCDTVKRVKELTKGEVSVHAEIFSPFSQMMEMLDYTNGLMALLEDPEKVKAILDRLAEGAAILGRKFVKDGGADAILISSAFTGAGMISRDHYEQFELPYMQRLIRGIKADGDTPVYVHTCGAIGDRMDLMEETGVDGIDTLDPPPLGTVELSKALEILGKRVFIKGNLDPVNSLLLGERADVDKAVHERLELAKPGGAYILSTACSVAPATPPENIEALAEIVDEAGVY